jgi:hypothetical protein
VKLPVFGASELIVSQAVPRVSSILTVVPQVPVVFQVIV